MDAIGTHDSLLGNGGFDLWQRGPDMLPDLWYGSSETVTAQRIDGSPARPTIVEVAVDDPGDFVFQKIERVADYAGMTVTASIDVNDGSGTDPIIQIDDGVTQSESTVPNGNFFRITVTHTIDVEATRLAVRIFPGTTSPGSIQFDSATLVVGDLMEVPYTPLHPADDLRRAERYYETGRVTYYSDDTTENLGDIWWWRFKTEKAAAPVVTFNIFESNLNVANLVLQQVTNTTTSGFSFDAENEDHENGGPEAYKVTLDFAAEVAVTY